MSDRKEEIRKKKSDIFSAAKGIFSKRGYHKAKMREIADSADIGKGTIYEYFSSKEDLFCQLFEDMMEEMQESILSYLSLLSSPSEKLRALISLLFEKYLEWEEICFIMFDFWGEGMRKDAGDRTVFDFGRIYANFRKTVASIISEGIERGIFKEIDALSTATIIIAALDGLFLQWAFDRQGFNVKQVLEDFIELVMENLERPRGAQQPLAQKEAL